MKLITIRFFLFLQLTLITLTVFSSNDTHWKNWDDQYFNQAKQQNKFVPLNLETVWCHVMPATTYKNKILYSKHGPLFMGHCFQNIKKGFISAVSAEQVIQPRLKNIKPRNHLKYKPCFSYLDIRIDAKTKKQIHPCIKRPTKKNTKRSFI